MTDLTYQLTSAERAVLAECERRIERGLKTFVEVGTALATIRDNRLYRAEYATFEDYCRERWGISRPRAYELMAAAEVVSGIPDTLPKPANAGQANELARVPEPERAEVWRQTVERTGGRPTAAAIRETYLSRTETPAALQPDLGEVAAPHGGAPAATPPTWDDWPTEPETLAVVEPQPPAKPEPAEWTDEELELRDRLEGGETVVVSMRRHLNLIAWAEQRGLYERIDRRTPWGNPFEMPYDGDRDTVIANYANHYLPHKPSLLSRLHTLRGKALGCWCAPDPCHGDVLKARAERC